MLQISPAKIAHVIIRAREFDSGVSGWGAEARGQHGTEDELRAFIASLNEDEKASLVAVMWIGRETFGPDELDEALATARAEATVPTEDYLLGVPLLADYLEDGMSALGLSPEDEEEDVLPLT
jgi:hypothetical protein